MDDRLSVLLIEPTGALGLALAQALVRLGSAVTCLGGSIGAELPCRLVPGQRGSAADWAALGPGPFDAAVDFGARGLTGARPVAGALRGRVGLVVQLGTWRVYEGSCWPTGTAPGADGPAMPVPCPESAPKRDGLALDAEDGLWQERAAGDYPATVLRLAALYGPGVALAREWYILGRLRAGRTAIALPDGGGQLHHRLYLDNAVHAILRAMDHPREADGSAYNVGDSQVPTVRQLAAGLATAVGRPAELVPLPSSLYAPAHPWAAPGPVVLDLHRLRARLGYAEPVPPDEALARTAAWLWSLAADDVLPTLEPYFARFGPAVDERAEWAALTRWQAILAGP